MSVDTKNVKAGQEFSCAVVDDNKVACWGSAGFGKMGVSDTNNRRLNPEITMDFAGKLSKIMHLSLGQYHTCVIGESALDSSKHLLFCTGSNTYGQVSGSGTMVTSPREVFFP